MRNGSLVAPVEEMRHGPFVGAGDHVLPHARLRIPCCHGPEGPLPIGQQRTALKSGGLPYLPQRAERVQDKQGDETEGPDSQAGQADEGHGWLKTPAERVDY
jgi:hypothetical protein